MTNKQLYNYIEKAHSLAIFSHVNPDPDAYGSSFGLREILRDIGKKAEVFAIKQQESYLDKIFPLDEVKTEFKPTDYDLAIVVDLNDLRSRIEKSFAENVINFKNLIVFDHHLLTEDDPLPTKKYNIESSFAACSQLIVQFALDNNLKISKNAASYLWAGLIGDTGRFLHSNLSVDVLKVAQVLFESGADVQHIYDAMFRQKSLSEIRVRNAITDRMKLLHNGKIGYVIFSLKDIKKLGGIDNDIKNYVNEIIEIQGVEFSLVFHEVEPKFYKVSVRSSSRINSSAFAKRFGGGGHKCASGFNINGTKKQIEKQIPTWVKDLLP